MPGQLGTAAEDRVLSIYVHLYGSEALGINSSTAQQLLLPSTCLVTKSRNAAILAAAAKNSKSNKGVSAMGNCSDSKENHPADVLDEVLCSVGVLGPLCV